MYYPSICQEGWSKSTKTSSRIVDAPVQIQTEYLQNTHLERYFWTSLYPVPAFTQVPSEKRAALLSRVIFLCMLNLILSVSTLYTWGRVMTSDKEKQ
jgi:hypothetical protein